MADDAHVWHRRFGVKLFNRCWELIESDVRTPDQDVEMLLTAATSRWHWGQVGGPGEVATGDWQVAHVAALLGMADLALTFAARNLAIAEAEGWDDWRLASAHEGMARACATAGDANGRETHVATARRLLDEEQRCGEPTGDRRPARHGSCCPGRDQQSRPSARGPCRR